MQPDAMDWKIIEILSECHVPNSQVAEQLDVSEGTVRRRIKALQSAGVMKVRALLNPEILANQQLALVVANVDKPDLLKSKAKEISELENVTSVSIISGRYDLLIEVLVESNKGLVSFITENLSKVEGISKTETFLILKSFGKYI